MFLITFKDICLVYLIGMESHFLFFELWFIKKNNNPKSLFYLSLSTTSWKTILIIYFLWFNLNMNMLHYYQNVIFIVNFKITHMMFFALAKSHELTYNREYLKIIGYSKANLSCDINDGKCTLGIVGSKNSTAPAYFIQGPRPMPRRKKHPRMNKESPSCQETSPGTILSSANRNRKKEEQYALKNSLPGRPKQKWLT